MTVRESAASFMEQICNDNSHGYSQINRWGPDYDCSSLVITCFEQAGVPVKYRGASYTGNMYSAFMACGFKDVTSKIDLTTGSGLIRGDVLLNVADHTALYLGNGKVGHARSSEGNSTPGDQSGNEIRTQSYWNFPWNYILRYPDDDDGTIPSAPVINNEPITVVNESVKFMTGKYPLLTIKLSGEEREDVKALQTILNLRGYFVDVDGYYGRETENKVMFAQKVYGITEDGECGADTWYYLITDNRR